MNGTLTEKNRQIAITKSFIVADAIKDAGEVGITSGVLRSMVSECLSEVEFDSIIRYLKTDKMIYEELGVYYWITRNFCNKLSALVSKEECDSCYSNNPEAQFFLLSSCRKRNIIKEI